MDIAEIDANDHPRVRDHLAVCWTAQYDALFGEPVARRMIASLASADVGGLLPGHDEIALSVRRTDDVIATCVGAERHAIGYVWGCYVRPDRQRRGYGSALMRAMVGRLLDARTIVVHVLDASAGARGFYQALGFEETGQTTFEIVPGIEAPATIMTGDPTAIMRHRNRDPCRASA